MMQYFSDLFPSFFLIAQGNPAQRHTGKATVLFRSSRDYRAGARDAWEAIPGV
jgi:hypothetical protein